MKKIQIKARPLYGWGLGLAIGRAFQGRKIVYATLVFLKWRINLETVIDL